MGLTQDGVLDAINRARSNPQKYAEALGNLKGRMGADRVLRMEDGARVATIEGMEAIDEAIGVLSALEPVAPLASSVEGLRQAAEDHVNDIGRTGDISHDGSDGSDPISRVARSGQWGDAVGEVIDFGGTTAEEVVMRLLVDDGSYGRRLQRANLLDPAFRVTGIHSGSHVTMGTMTCIVLAHEFGHSVSAKHKAKVMSALAAAGSSDEVSESRVDEFVASLQDSRKSVWLKPPTSIILAQRPNTTMASTGTNDPALESLNPEHKAHGEIGADAGEEPDVITPADVLLFWFGEEGVDGMDHVAEGEWGEGGLAPFSQQNALWFNMDADLEEQISSDKIQAEDERCFRFRELVRSAGRGELMVEPEWAGDDGLFAQLILCDRIAQRCFRNTPEAYEYQFVAIDCSRNLFDNGGYVSYDLPHTLFLLSPGHHSEDAIDHDMNDEIMGVLGQLHGEDNASMDLLREMAAGYRSVIEQFGRNPARNQSMGRTPTQSEGAWLEAQDGIPWFLRTDLLPPVPFTTDALPKGQPSDQGTAGNMQGPARSRLLSGAQDDEEDDQQGQQEEAAQDVGDKVDTQPQTEASAHDGDPGDEVNDDIDEDESEDDAENEDQSSDDNDDDNDDDHNDDGGLARVQPLPEEDDHAGGRRPAEEDGSDGDVSDISDESDGGVDQEAAPDVEDAGRGDGNLPPEPTRQQDGASNDTTQECEEENGTTADGEAMQLLSMGTGNDGDADAAAAAATAAGDEGAQDAGDELTS